jgi:hypothetical protein
MKKTATAAKASVILFLLLVVGRSPCAWSTPTQEEVLRSINENVSEGPDYGRMIPWILAAAGVVVAVTFFRQRQKQQANPKPLNHPKKLVREIIRTTDIESTEMKQLWNRAKELDCDNPLTLILCPSLLSPPKADEPAAAKDEASATAAPDHNIL